MAPRKAKATSRARKRQLAKPKDVQSSVLAALLGVTQRQIANLAKQGMPHDGENYSPAACVQWYVRAKLVEAKPADERAARARKLTAEATSAEMDVMERRGDLIPRPIFEARYQKFAQQLFGAVMGEIPTLIRTEFPELDVIDAQERAGRICDAIIAACRANADAVDDGVSEPEAAPTAPAEDNGSVRG